MVIALPWAVLGMLLLLAAIGVNPVTKAIASMGPSLVIGSWVAAVPIGIVTIVLTHGRWKIVGIAAILLAGVEPLIALGVWVGSG